MFFLPPHYLSIDLVNNMLIIANVQMKTEMNNMDYHPCPNCNEECEILKVKKPTPNQNRPYISCQQCETFCWVDLGFCSRCSSPMKEFTVKKDGRNHGRTFRRCPNNCVGSFTWAD